MAQARYCYQVPLLLGQGFRYNTPDPEKPQSNPSDQKNSKEKQILVFTYDIKIEGWDKSFAILSPSFLGHLCQFSIKLPEIDNQNRVRIVRKKINFGAPTKLILTPEYMETLQTSHRTLWKIAYPNLDLNKLESKPVKISETTQFTCQSYNELRRQYFIFPIKKKKNADGSYTPDFDFKSMKFINRDREGKIKPNSKKNFKNNIFRSKKTGELYNMIDLMLSLSNAKCQDFLFSYFSVLNSGIGYNQDKPEDMEKMLKMMEDLGMKDITQKKFLDYLYVEGLEKNSQGGNSFLRPIKRFISQHPNKKEIENTTLMFGIHAVTCEDHDFNFSEKIQSFKSNKQMKKMNLPSSACTLLLSHQIENTNVTYSFLDRLILMPSILVNVERLVQMREFKVMNKFMFMKNYPLLKAFCSRSYDKVLNNETLETIGDSVLKTIVTLHLFKQSDTIDENLMTQKRTELINNNFLGEKGMDAGIQFFLKTEYTPVKNKWIPPTYALKKRLASDEPDEAQTISSKQVADCVEACIGAAFLSTNRLYDSLLVLKRFKILEKFNFTGFEKYFTEKFDFDISAIPELDKSISFNSSYRQLLRLGDTGIFKKIRRPTEMKTRISNIQKNLKPEGKAKGKGSEIRLGEEGKKFIKNYISDFSLKYFKHDKAELHTSLRHYNSILQTRHLGYTFKNSNLLKTSLKPEAKDQKVKNQFERNEFLGDALIEIITLMLARKVFVYLKKPYSPEMLHSVKVTILSTEGLARIFNHLKLHRFMLLGQFGPKVYQNIVKYLEDCDPHGKFKNLWWGNQTKPPKMLADVVESLMGAVFLDGGWKSLYNVFGRIVLPQVFYCCKYFDKMATDLIHDIIAFHDKLNEKIYFKYQKGSCKVIVHRGNGDEVLTEIKGDNEKLCKRKAAVEVMKIVREKYEGQKEKVIAEEEGEEKNQQSG